MYMPALMQSPTNFFGFSTNREILPAHTHTHPCTTISQYTATTSSNTLLRTISVSHDDTILGRVLHLLHLWVAVVVLVLAVSCWFGGAS